MKEGEVGLMCWEPHWRAVQSLVLIPAPISWMGRKVLLLGAYTRCFG